MRPAPSGIRQELVQIVDLDANMLDAFAPLFDVLGDEAFRGGSFEHRDQTITHQEVRHDVLQLDVFLLPDNARRTPARTTSADSSMLFTAIAT